MQETWVRSLGWEDPWRRKWQPTPVLLPGKSHGQRNLVGYSAWGRKSQTRLSDFTFTFTRLSSSSDSKDSACNAGNPDSIPGLGSSPGEGNGSPLQYSCLENSMDRGVGQVTVLGVTKSRISLSD